MGQRLGTPISGNLINCTGYVVSVSGITGLGTGVATFLGNTLPASVTTFLGTPSSANLRGALTDETGTGAAVFATSPTITTPNIVGTATNDDASAGSVGEYGENTLANVSSITLTNNTAADVITVSLAAGDYDVWGVVVFSLGGSTVVTQQQAWIGTTANSFPGTDSGAVGGVGFGAGKTGGSADYLCTPSVRMSLGSTTTVRLGVRMLFTTSSGAASGTIKWRRRR